MEEHSLSLFSLFWQADIVVKAVMVGLLIASLVSWAIIFEKISKFGAFRIINSQFINNFWSGKSLDEMYNKYSQKKARGCAAIFLSAMTEWRQTVKGSKKGFISLDQRLEKKMQLIITQEMESLQKRLSFLATVGSASPFIGLFGTVWGIMNAFQAIGISKNTSLAVVAPGIAEALLATAIGLVAAIPAVIFYNKLSSDAAKLGQLMEDFADEFYTILLRQIDEHRI